MGIIDRIFGKRKKEKSSSEATAADPLQSKDHCSSCGKNFERPTGGVYVGGVMDWFERASVRPVTCPNCGAASCVQCCYDAGNRVRDEGARVNAFD